MASPVVSRLGGRLVTGPAAFLVAGAVDISLLLVAYVRWRMAERRRPSSA